MRNTGSGSLSFYMENKKKPPRNVVRAAARAARARETLVEEIRRAHADGLSLREIGRAAGMSHEHVRRIVAGE